ncbi:DMT family transporter [Gymnodinialimonas sp. 2305UL16-5]|uniref:DMT family transporter n=1 Tax=Gymnodinialimonas mytili TaxID=3126503 RepID=UPI0030984081
MPGRSFCRHRGVGPMSGGASPTAPGLLNWILVISLGVIWGTAFMSTSLALDGIGPWWVAAGRLGLAAVILLILGSLMGQGITHVRPARAWVFTGLVGTITLAGPIVLLSWSLTQVPSAFAGVAMGAVPLIVLPLVAIFSPEEGIGPRRIIGVLLGFGGLVLLVGQGALDGGTFWGRLGCIGAAAGYAIGSILTRRAPKVPPVAFATATLVMGSLVLIPVAWILEGPPRIESASAAWALAYAALFPTGLAAILRVRVITTAGSMFMSMTSYMVPVWAVIFGATLMQEDLPSQLYVALLLILAGIGISQSRAIATAIAQQLRPKTKTQ